MPHFSSRVRHLRGSRAAMAPMKRRKGAKKTRGTRYTHVTDYYLMPLVVPAPEGTPQDIPTRYNYYDDATTGPGGAPVANPNFIGHVRNLSDMRESGVALSATSASTVVFRCGLHEQTFNNLGVKPETSDGSGYCYNTVTGYKFPHIAYPDTTEGMAACTAVEANSWHGKVVGGAARKVGYQIGYNKIPDKWGVMNHPAPGIVPSPAPDTLPSSTWTADNRENMLWVNSAATPGELTGKQICAQIKSFPNTADAFAAPNSYFIPNSVLKYIDIDMKFASAGNPFNNRLTLKVVRRIGPFPEHTYEWDTDSDVGGDNSIAKQLMLNHGSKTNTQQYQTLYTKSINIPASKPGQATNNAIYSIKKKLHVNLPRSQIRSVNAAVDQYQFGSRAKNRLEAASDGFFNACYIVITCKNLDDHYVANVSVPINAQGTVHENISVLKHIDGKQQEIVPRGPALIPVNPGGPSQVTGTAAYCTLNGGEWIKTVDSQIACAWAAENGGDDSGFRTWDLEESKPSETLMPCHWVDTRTQAGCEDPETGICCNFNTVPDICDPWGSDYARNRSYCYTNRAFKQWKPGTWDATTGTCRRGPPVDGVLAPELKSYCSLNGWCTSAGLPHGVSAQNPYSTPTFAQFKFGGKISMASDTKTTNRGTQTNALVAGVGVSDAPLAALSEAAEALVLRMNALQQQVDGSGAVQAAEVADHEEHHTDPFDVDHHDDVDAQMEPL